MLRVLLSVYLCLGVSDEFLLEPNTQSAVNLTGNKQYMTIAEFYEAKNEQLYEHNVLRHQIEKMKADSDKTLALLTSQIQQKLLSIENTQQVNGRTNDTNELKELRQIITGLEDNNTQLQQNLTRTLMKCTVMETELHELRNTTAKLGKDVETLQKLKSIQQLQNLNGLIQEVQRISSRAHTLDVNQQARNQDFLALYNQTIINQNELKSLGQKHEADKNETLTLLQNMKTKQNRSRAILYEKIDTIDENINKTYTEMIEKANEKVGFTSCAISNRVYLQGNVIQFEDVLYYVGISNMTSFTLTGKFRCTTEGLFQISVSILSRTNDQRFGIYMNGHLVSKGYISGTDDYESGTGIAVVALDVTDEVWVQPVDTKLQVHSFATCITVVKIK
ncbi:chromosome partition protein Smc-like [Mytilus edulis]|uniref:chromosome partition protein Smc-like n=1 Tax=Mytilus edulis TaxID=6550 RepID=UPI0039EDEF2F